MSNTSTIEWTEATWNPVAGCTRVSPGCDHCYAVRQSYRLERMGQEKYAGLTVLNGRGERHFNGVVRCVPEALGVPLQWRKPRRIFVNSMSDLFHRGVPFEFIDRVFAVMALCPQHVFQVLTKRPERMAEYLDSDYGHAAGMSVRIGCAIREIVGRTPFSVWHGGRTEEAITRFDDGEGVLPNVHLGTSVEDQAAADERIPHLLRCPAVVRFLSCEPLLGEVKLWRRVQDIQRAEVVGYTKASQIAEREREGLDWVIVGGESGGGARPCDVAWIRSIVAQCRAAQVPCFVKQLGASPWEDNGWGAPCAENLLKLRDRKGKDMAEWPCDLRVREWPRNAGGSKAAREQGI